MKFDTSIKAPVADKIPYQLKKHIAIYESITITGLKKKKTLKLLIIWKERMIIIKE